MWRIFSLGASYAADTSWIRNVRSIWKVVGKSANNLSVRLARAAHGSMPESMPFHYPLGLSRAASPALLSNFSAYDMAMVHRHGSDGQPTLDSSPYFFGYAKWNLSIETSLTCQTLMFWQSKCILFSKLYVCYFISTLASVFNRFLDTLFERLSGGAALNEVTNGQHFDAFLGVQHAAAAVAGDTHRAARWYPGHGARVDRGEFARHRGEAGSNAISATHGVVNAVPH